MYPNYAPRAPWPERPPGAAPPTGLTPGLVSRHPAEMQAGPTRTPRHQHNRTRVRNRTRAAASLAGAFRQRGQGRGRCSV